MKPFHALALLGITSFLLTTCNIVYAQINFRNLDLNKVFKTAQDAKDATAEISEQNEILIGQEIASNLLGLAPLVNDQKTQEYVNRVGRWLALQTERPDLPWAFAVLDSDEVNAFAAPGGFIVITKGLLSHMRNEAELAGVLAHEIVHVLKKHHLNATKKAGGMNLAKDLVSIGIDAKGGNPAFLKLASAGTELYTRGLDKGDEFEADRLAVVIAARAGYEPFGLPTVLQAIQAMNAKDENLSLMFETHPPVSDRLSMLEKVMSSSFDRFENQADLSSRFIATLYPPAPQVPAKKSAPEKKTKNNSAAKEKN